MGDQDLTQGSIVSYSVPSGFWRKSGLGLLGDAATNLGVVISNLDELERDPEAFSICPILYADKSRSDWDLPLDDVSVARPDLIQKITKDYWSVLEEGHVSETWTSVDEISHCFDAVVSPKGKPVSDEYNCRIPDYAQIRWREDLPSHYGHEFKDRMLLIVSSPDKDGYLLALRLLSQKKKSNRYSHYIVSPPVLEKPGFKRNWREGYVECFSPVVVHKDELGKCQAILRSTDMEAIAMRMAALTDFDKFIGLSYMVREENRWTHTSIPSYAPTL